MTPLLKHSVLIPVAALAAAFGLLSVCLADGPDPPARYAFHPEIDQLAGSAVDAADLNPGPIDETRRIEVKDGHFVDAGGRAVRLLGANLAQASIPTKEESEKLARRMRVLGVNAVRTGELDEAATTPEDLDRLDYLAAQLKESGIYLVLRFGTPPGEAAAGYERRKHAVAALMRRENGITGQTYAQDPVIALIEFAAGSGRRADARRFLREEAGVRAPVVCAPVSGAVSELVRASEMDWVIAAERASGGEPSLVDRLARLAMRRIEGRPYAVSGVILPPSSARFAGALPMLACVAARQEWDAIFLDGLAGETDPLIAAQLHAAARLFLGPDRPVTETHYILNIPGSLARAVSSRGSGDIAPLWGANTRSMDLIHARASVRFTESGAASVEVKTRTQLPPGMFECESSAADSLLLRAAVPGSHVIAGFRGGRALSTEDNAAPALEITPREETGASFSYTLSSLDGKPTAQSGSMLLTAAGGRQAQVIVHTRAGAASVYCLDESGRRKREVASSLAGGRLEFQVAPDQGIAWYEIAMAAAPGRPARGAFPGISRPDGSQPAPRDAFPTPAETARPGRVRGQPRP